MASRRTRASEGGDTGTGPTGDERHVRLEAAKWPLFMEPETRSYRVGDTEADVVQFLVQDLDGYLIRFQQRLDVTPVT